MGVETMTVMFTDLVDSTSLLSRLGGEQGEVARREHFGLLREAIEPSGGREVKNLGDGLMVVFPSAVDALAAAVRMQHSITRRNEQAAGDRFLVRIGISCGDADVEDGDYFGMPVVEAARLCGAASGGEVLVTDLVRLLAGRRGGHTFTSAGAIELKGLDDPVVAHRIEWETEQIGPGPPPLPPRLAAVQAATFVGREPEQARLAQAWKAVDTRVAADVGAGVGLVFVAGEPGIGKTTLSARFAKEVHEQGAVVVYGRCDEDLRIPYQPWVEALTQVVSWLPEAVLSAHVAERGGSIARLVEGLSRRLGAEVPEPADGDEQRFVLFACVADLLARAAEERPLLVVLDDLHWADRATTQLLRHLATAGPATRVGVLGTFRDSDIGPSHPLADTLAELHRDRPVERISLQGFGSEDLLSLLERVAGHEMTEDAAVLRDALLAETSGNPFFAVEVLRHLAEVGAISQGAEGRWRADDIQAAGMPNSVKEVVRHRLASLGPEAERVLATAAVLGRDFDVTALAEVAEVDEDVLVALCDAAVAAAVLTTTDDPDRYSFAHALIAHTLYDGLSPARRGRTHRAVAEQLEATLGPEPGDRVGELARHWMAATSPVEPAKAVHHATAAGARALDQMAPDEALRWFEEASVLVARHGFDDRQRAEILLGLGNAQRQCGVAGHRETLMEAARLADRIDATDLLVQAVLAGSRGMASAIGKADPERLAMIQRALERVGETDLALRAQLLALVAAERAYVDDLVDRLALAHEAVGAARRSADPRVLSLVLPHCMFAITAPSTLAQQVEWCDEQCRIAEQSSDPTVRMWAARMRCQQALAQGDAATYRSSGAVLDLAIDRVPSAAWRWMYQYLVALRAIVDGDLEEAERLAGAAYALGEQGGQLDAGTIYAGQLTNIREHQGRLDELIPQITEVLTAVPGLRVFRGVLANACARSGRREQAAEILETDRAGGLAMPEDHTWLVGHVEWACAAVLIGDTTIAALLRDRLRPYSDQIATSYVSTACAGAHYLGMLDHLLGRHDDADAWFEQAMAIHDGMASPLLVAYTEAAWGGLLADRDRGDDRQRARAMAERAVAVASTRGYGYIEADARAVLAQAQ